MTHTPATVAILTSLLLSGAAHAGDLARGFRPDGPDRYRLAVEGGEAIVGPEGLQLGEASVRIGTGALRPEGIEPLGAVLHRRIGEEREDVALYGAVLLRDDATGKEVEVRVRAGRLVLEGTEVSLLEPRGLRAWPEGSGLDEPETPRPGWRTLWIRR